MYDHSGQQIVIVTNYPVVAKVRERVAVSKQTMNRLRMERFNLKVIKRGRQ
jgi:hypothetical protein